MVRSRGAQSLVVILLVGACGSRTELFGNDVVQATDSGTFDAAPSTTTPPPVADAGVRDASIPDASVHDAAADTRGDAFVDSSPPPTSCAIDSDCPAGLACHAGVCTNQAPPAGGLVGWWRFEDPAPAANDASGNGNNGTAQRSFSQVPGRVGLGYALSGGCIGVPDSPSLAMDGNGQVTTMMWIEAAGACSTTIDNCEFMNHENTYEKAQGSGFEMSVVGGFGEAIQRSDASWFWTEQTPNVITPGTWLHVAVTWDGVNVTRYLDGAVLADPTNPRALSAPPTFASSGWGLGIGCRSITANGGIAGPYLGFIGLSLFTGIVDEAALYDRALTPAEIAAYYAATD